MYTIGDYVKMKNSNIVGIIKKIINKNNTFYYHIDITEKKVILKQDNIEKIDKITIQRKQKSDFNFYNFENTFFPEITIRHQTLEIAMYNVENFIKEAIQNNIKNIKIIHGRNGGVLRKAVHEYLKHNKNIESFRLGNYYEGSYGVTIIKLK